MQLFGIKTPLIVPGDDMASVLCGAMKSAGITPQDNDIIVLAESAVASAEGRMVRLEDITPGKEAIELSKIYENDPRKMELILRESEEILGGIPGVVVTITKGVLSPSAGIDNSNAPEGHVVLLPENPKKSAIEIQKKLMKEYRCNIAVIIGDSRTQPLRLGCVGIALACAGIEPVEDMRGHIDLFGKPLLITRRATADNLVSAAQVIMGEADEGIPAVLIRDAPVRFIKGSEDIPVISRDECLYFGCFDKGSNNRNTHLPKEAVQLGTKLNIFHYGGFFPSDKTMKKNRNQLDKLDDIFEQIEGVSITSEPAAVDNKFIPEEKCSILDKYDIIFIDDIAKNCRDYGGMKKFIELNIREKGQTLIFLGGYGLTSNYNEHLGQYLGVKIKKRFPEDTHKNQTKQIKANLQKNIKISRGIGKGLNFSGFNVLEPMNSSDVLSWFEVDGNEYPALISHKMGNGKIMIFASSSHPSWGTPALKKSDDFKKMWIEILNHIMPSSLS